MDARWGLVVLLLPLVSGCLITKIFDQDVWADPDEGDLILTISMERTVYSVEEIANRAPNSSIMTLTIVLENVCDRSVSVDRSFHIGTTLHPRSYAENGTEVDLLYPLVDREVVYERFKPGETKVCQMDLTEYDAFLMTDGERQPFGWDVPGRYNVSIGWWGARTYLEVMSNTLTFHLV